MLQREREAKGDGVASAKGGKDEPAWSDERGPSCAETIGCEEGDGENKTRSWIGT